MPHICKGNWILLQNIFPHFHTFHFEMIYQCKSGIWFTFCKVNAKLLHQPHEDALQPGAGARLVYPAVKEVVLWDVCEQVEVYWSCFQVIARILAHSLYGPLPTDLLLQIIILLIGTVSIVVVGQCSVVTDWLF